MTIIVSPLSYVTAMIGAHKPTHIISLLDPATPTPNTGFGKKHLRVTLQDFVAAAGEGSIGAEYEHIEKLLEFAFDWNRAGPLLIHDRTGHGRACAAAYIIACAFNPQTSDTDVALKLRAASPTAQPTMRLVLLADAVLGRDGRMNRAVEEIENTQQPEDTSEVAPFVIPSTYDASR